MTKTVLITGATSGIGLACAEIFVANGCKVIITGRRSERLAEIQKTFLEKYNNHVLTLCFDVQKKQEVNQAMDNLPTEFQKIDILINNAGLALGKHSFEEANMDDWETMIDTNIKGLLYVSRAVLPYMVAQNTGHIINIGSTAGKEVYENGNVYCATKYSVDAITKAQRIELLKYGIKVTSINPGAVETEFSLIRFKGDETKANAVYKNWTPLQAQDVANVIYFVATLPEMVCVNDLTLTSKQQANSFYFNIPKI